MRREQPMVSAGDRFDHHNTDRVLEADFDTVLVMIVDER
jgi:hypothetical protein